MISSAHEKKCNNYFLSVRICCRKLLLTDVSQCTKIIHHQSHHQPCYYTASHSVKEQVRETYWYYITSNAYYSADRDIHSCIQRKARYTPAISQTSQHASCRCRQFIMNASLSFPTQLTDNTAQLLCFNAMSSCISMKYNYCSMKYYHE